jgi:hypothetical protein
MSVERNMDLFLNITYKTVFVGSETRSEGTPALPTDVTLAI